MPGAGRQLVRDSSGNLYAVVNDGTLCEVWKSSDGGDSWTEQDSGGRPNCNPGSPLGAAIDSADDIWIVYHDGVSGLQIKVVKFDTGISEFLTSESVITAVDKIHQMDIAVDSNDIPHVVGETVELESTYTFRLVYDNRVGGSWGTDVVVDSCSNCSGSQSSPFFRSPSITINEDNKPEVSYVDFDLGFLGYAIGYSNDPGAGEFDIASIDTSINTAGGQTGTSIVVDSSGNTWIAYKDGGVNQFITLLERLDASATSTWETAINNSGEGYEPSLVIDGTDIYMFYEAVGTNADDIVYDKYDGSWLGETVLEAGTFQDVKAKWSFNNFN